MAYPEKGAGYQHKPKWAKSLDRAEGGSVKSDSLSLRERTDSPWPTPDPALLGEDSEVGPPIQEKLETARKELGTQLKDRAERRSKMTLREKDQEEATQNATSSGDYKDDSSGRGVYSPFRPKRGQ